MATAKKAKTAAPKKTTKKTVSAKAPRAAAKPAAATMKPIKEPLNKTGLANHLAQASGASYHFPTAV